MYFHDCGDAALSRGDQAGAQRWKKEAREFLERGMTAMPIDCLLHFAAADYFESHVS